MFAAPDATGSCSPVMTGYFDCPTLRAAVIASDAAGGSNTITLSTGVFGLSIAPSGVDDTTTGDLNITDSVAISGGGPAATVIDAGGIDRAFDVANGASLTLTGLEVKHGVTAAGSGDGEGGGAIEANSSGAATATSVVLTSNTASAGNGGAIDSQGGAVTVTASTISGNTATNGSGGGIYAGGPASFAISRSTISTNTATGTGDGGGIALATGSASTSIANTTIAANAAAGTGGGLYANVGTGSLAIVNATIVDGTSSAAGGANIRALGGGPGAIAIQNSVVGGGLGGGSPDNCDLTANANDAGNNLFFDTIYNPSSTDNCFPSPTGAGDILAGSGALAGGPGLQQDAAGQVRLAANGGPTQTAALVRSSPALDQANAAACASPAPAGPGGVDQRGSTRFPNGTATCDIGAIEPEAALALTGSATPNPGTVGQPLTFRFTVANAGPDVSLLTQLTASAPGGAVGAIVPSQGSCANLFTSVMCSLGSLASGVTNATVSMTVVPSSPGTYSSTATAGNEQSRPTPPLVLSVPVTGSATATPATAAAASAPAEAAAAAAAAAAATLTKKAAAKSTCASARQIKIHIQNVHKFHLVSAKVLVNGKAKASVDDKRLSAAINLRNLPKGKFTVTIIARQGSGRTITGKRVYHTCRHNRLAGHKHLLL